MAETVTLESPDGRRIRTDSPTEIKTLTGSHGYRIVDDDTSSTKSKQGNKTTSRKPKQDSAPQETQPAHEPDTNPIDPQTRADTA